MIFRLAGPAAACLRGIVVNDAVAGASADRTGRISPMDEILKARGKKLNEIETCGG
jgi:hypothetical protein